MKAFPTYFHWNPLWYSCDNCHGACSRVLLNFLDAVVHVTLRLPVTCLGNLTPVQDSTIMGPVMVITLALLALQRRIWCELSLNHCFLMPALSCSCCSVLKKEQDWSSKQSYTPRCYRCHVRFRDWSGLEWIIFNQLQIVFKEITVIHDNPVEHKLIF